MPYKMDESMAFQKILHLLVDQFIIEFESYIEETKVDKNKVFLEIIKRSSAISERIRCLSHNFLTSFKTTGVPVSQDEIQNKIHHLVEASLQEDLLECALSAKEEFASGVCPSSDVLHNILFICSMEDAATVTPSLIQQLRNISLGNGGFSLQPPSAFGSGLQLSNQLEIAKRLFENELSQLRSSLHPGVSNLDLKSSGGSKGDNRSVEDVLENKVFNVPDSHTSALNVEDWLQFAINAKGNCDDSRYAPTGWESGMKQAIPCHLYTTELSGKEVSFNLTEEDPQVFRSLHNSSGALSESDWIHDILDMLVGIPSWTFLFDEGSKQFKMRSYICLSQMSYESTFRLSEVYIELGTTYQRLKRFYEELIYPDEGLVIKGLKNGVQEILSIYMEYVVAVKANKPTMQELRTQVLENVQLLNVLGGICRIYSERNASQELPKGLNLLSYLNKTSWSYKNRGSAIIMAVLLKYTYSPYLSFLNKWIADGVCFDPCAEFHIIEDAKYLDRKDELYWKFAYTENEEDTARIIPSEISKYSHDILQCGKSMRLLQKCCPELFHLEYAVYNPAPSLSLMFSYDAIHRKKEECEAYILQKDLCEQTHKENNQTVSADMFYIEQQKFVDAKIVVKQIEKIWNRTCLSSPNATNALKESERGRDNLRRCHSFPDVTLSKESGAFSGIVHNSIGLLFGTLPKNVQDQHKKSSFCSPLQQHHSSNSYIHTVPCSNRFERHLQDKFHSTTHPKMTVDQNEGSEKKPKSSAVDPILRSDLPPGSFMDSLISLLLSGDSKRDVYSFIQMTSLQSLLQHNFSSVLTMRMHLIQKAIMDYVIHQLKLQDLLLCLQNTYFLRDECFSQSVCRKLFKWVLKCSTLDEFADWSTLNDILTRSVNVPSFAGITFLETASVNFVSLPEEYIYKGHKFLNFFQFEFKVEWPLNIIISKACITQYSSIFSFLLKMEFLGWLLGKVWRTLIYHAKNKNIENSPQYRKMMLDRFDMHQFIRVLRNCIHQDIGGPLWESLLTSLSTRELSIDALEEIHIKYLEKALLRCFLTENMSHLYETLQLLFTQVYNFCDTAFFCCWELNPRTSCSETDCFTDLSDFYKSYKKCKEYFYECISKMATRRAFKRCWDEQYQLYLETILETGQNVPRGNASHF